MKNVVLLHLSKSIEEKTTTLNDLHELKKNIIGSAKFTYYTYSRHSPASGYGI